MMYSKRMWGTISFCLLLLASAALLAAWHNQGARFNQILVGANLRIGRSTTVVGETLQQAIQAKQPNLDEVKRVYEALLAEFQQVSERMNQLEIPDLPHARELFAAHQQFLAGQKVIIEDDMGEMIHVLQIDSLAKAQRAAKLKEIAQRIRDKHEADFANFEAVQQVFAEQNGFRLKP